MQNAECRMKKRQVIEAFSSFFILHSAFCILSFVAFKPASATTSGLPPPSTISPLLLLPARGIRSNCARAGRCDRPERARAGVGQLVDDRARPPLRGCASLRADYRLGP